MSCPAERRVLFRACRRGKLGSIQRAVEASRAAGADALEFEVPGRRARAPFRLVVGAACVSCDLGVVALPVGFNFGVDVEQTSTRLRSAHGLHVHLVANREQKKEQKSC